MAKITKNMVNQMGPFDFERFMHERILPVRSSNIVRAPGVYLHFPFDLRTGLDDKMNYAAVGTVWTAFVNNTGTLAHVVCPQAEILIRIKFNFPINALSGFRMKEVIMAYITPWINHTGEI